MISVSRVLTVLRKDFLWAQANVKLLGVMILPVFLVVFFSKLDSAATFVFSVTFVNAFVGIFSTSYLIIEEKNRGTLLALLTTPLTGAELLLGKFLFNLILCVFFSILAAFMNNRLDVIYQPLIFLNILLYAGTTCFVGYTIGIFFKNEQEMSVLAPFIMFFFCFGDAADKLSSRSNIHAFFPDYHLAQALKDLTIPPSQLLAHSAFSFLLFAVAFLAATFYTSFYFSNSREKRYSSRLMSLIAIFFTVMISSGFYYSKVKAPQAGEDGRHIKEFTTAAMKVSFSYDPKKLNMKSVLETRVKNMFILSESGAIDFKVVITTREVEDDEKTNEERIKKVKEDAKRHLLAHEVFDFNDQKLNRFVYTKRGEMIVLSEARCGDQLVQWSLDHDLKNMKDIKRSLEFYDDVSKSFKLNCL